MSLHISNIAVKETKGKNNSKRFSVRLAENNLEISQRFI